MGLISRVSSRTYRSFTENILKNALQKSNLPSPPILFGQPTSHRGPTQTMEICFLHRSTNRRCPNRWIHWERPEAIDYPWLSIRRRPLPWGGMFGGDDSGKRTLFHNKQLNRVVGQGYDEEYNKPSH